MASITKEQAGEALLKIRVAYQWSLPFPWNFLARFRDFKDELGHKSVIWLIEHRLWRGVLRKVSYSLFNLS